MEILKMKTFFKRRKNNGNFKRGNKIFKKRKDKKIYISSKSSLDKMVAPAFSSAFKPSS